MTLPYNSLDLGNQMFTFAALYVAGLTEREIVVPKANELKNWTLQFKSSRWASSEDKILFVLALIFWRIV